MLKITIEGPQGSGKTTASTIMVKALTKAGYFVEVRGDGSGEKEAFFVETFLEMQKRSLTNRGLCDAVGREPYGTKTAQCRKPAGHVPASEHAFYAPVSEVVRKARDWLFTVLPAVSGSSGHAATFAVAQKLVRDFTLLESDVWDLLLDYNQRCQPPWSEKELRHKLDQALAIQTR
jgi:hypothetical protein